MKNYLQRAWSDAVDNIKIDEVKEAILETQTMDDEHGAFWVGVFDEEETVLETHKDMKLIAVFNGNDEGAITRQANNWNEVLFFYELLLRGDFDQLSTKMKQ